jgi:hypothetical protein
MPSPQHQQSAALFPASMFPSLSQYQAPQSAEHKQAMEGSKDDVLELVVLGALLKLLSG